MKARAIKVLESGIEILCRFDAKGNALEAGLRGCIKHDVVMVTAAAEAGHVGILADQVEAKQVMIERDGAIKIGDVEGRISEATITKGSSHDFFPWLRGGC